MKPQFLTIACACFAHTNAATTVSFWNGLLPDQALPIVDEFGVPIDSNDLLLSVGTLDPAFVANVTSLNPLEDDQLVADAFMPTGSSVPAFPLALDGFFNTQVPNTDSGNFLLGQDIFLLIEHVAAPETQVILVDLNTTFPTQDAIGFGTAPSGPPLTFDDVLFGETGQGEGIQVDQSVYPPILQTSGLSRGVTFDPIPEPSTGLLVALSALGAAITRRR